MKKSEVPAKGSKIKAVYKKNGVSVKPIDLGTVKEANTKYFVDESGTKRPYNFDENNGVVVTGFVATKKAAANNEKKED